MNITGSDHPEDVREAELANLKMVPSRVVKPPRVGARRSRSNASTTRPSTWCRSNGKKSINSLVIGEVVNVHIDDAA